MSVRVAVLKGGRSLERGVSLRSGAQVQDALERLHHDVVAIDAGADLAPMLRDAAPEVAFVALHGRDGEDGTVQELLEAMDIPYTGSGPAGCMRCTDKVLAKHLLREAELPTPDFYAFKERSIKRVGRRKRAPRRRAQARVSDGREARAAGLGARRQVRALERGAAGGDRGSAFLRPQGAPRALHAGPRSRGLGARSVAGRAGGDGLRALPVVEAVPTEKDFYDFEARYEIGRTRFVCPAELSAELAERARELALSAYRLLGCRGFARVDLMLAEQDDAMHVLEVNVVPGLTETSLLPQAADAAGIGFDELIEMVLASALSRREHVTASV